MEEKKHMETNYEDEILTLGQAAKCLNASASTVLRLVQDGELRAFRMRKARRTSREACDEFTRRSFDERAVICKSIDAR